jgi:hypothetical protein
MQFFQTEHEQIQFYIRFIQFIPILFHILAAYTLW